MIINKLGNITALVIEDTDNDKDQLVRECISSNTKSFNTKMLYIDCLNDRSKISMEFINNDYTKEKLIDPTNGLHITYALSLNDALTKISFSIIEKGVEEVYINFPDTIVNEIPNLPEDYDFIALLMNFTLFNKDKFKNTKFIISVFERELKSNEFIYIHNVNINTLHRSY